MKSESAPSVVAHPSVLWPSLGVAVIMAASVGLLAGCSSMKKSDAGDSASATPAVMAASAPAPVVEEPVVKKPSAGDLALADGLKAYQAGQYKMAETQLKTALQSGLSAPADVANANKHLAFIYCTSKRDTPCLAAFKAAKAADPSFALSKAEAGHPMWTRTYKKAMGIK